jgi:competence protein ComEC
VFLSTCLAAFLAAVGTGAAATLQIYFIDVEGGQSTLLVTPAGETLLVDTGFPGDGRFQSRPADPPSGRDAQRIAAAARDAGVSRIDYLLVTHFHADHVGGVAELAELLPIGTFVDHGTVPPEAETNVPGTLALFDAYAAIRSRGRHLQPRPGDRLPIRGVAATVVSTDRKTLAAPLAGAGAPNPVCATASPPQEPNENPRSTGVLIQYERFRFLDVGDLSGPPLFALTCPRNLVGPIDLYLVPHHGGGDAADPATIAAFRPRAAIVNNGPTKGGARETLTMLQAANGVETWQLHRAEAAGDANVPAERIANLDTSTAHWVKVTARGDGSFTVVNGRTAASRTYSRRPR